MTDTPEQYTPELDKLRNAWKAAIQAFDEARFNGDGDPFEIARVEFLRSYAAQVEKNPAKLHAFEAGSPEHTNFLLGAVMQGYFTLAGEKETLQRGMERIQNCSRALRHGGCDADDLTDLEDALQEAVDIAAECME